MLILLFRGAPRGPERTFPVALAGGRRRRHGLQGLGVRAGSAESFGPGCLGGCGQGAGRGLQSSQGSTGEGPASSGSEPEWNGGQRAEYFMRQAGPVHPVLVQFPTASSTCHPHPLSTLSPPLRSVFVSAAVSSEAQTIEADDPTALSTTSLPPAARNHLLPIAGGPACQTETFFFPPTSYWKWAPVSAPPRPNPRPPSGRSRTSLWLCLFCESLCSGAVGGGWCPRPLEALLVCWGHQGEIVVTSSGQFSCLLWIHPRKSSLPRGYDNDVAQVVLEITECLRGKTNGGFSSHGNGIYLQRSPRVRAGQL